MTKSRIENKTEKRLEAVWKKENMVTEIRRKRRSRFQKKRERATS